ncbi:hypothetical protein MLD38_008374 [Melastoma candidum]|uniref:Uncharacterized protein n=1 Tax=Melastoma candidum TaxID=119954 RepID=A0ACB9S2M3_9MYRT|nr:hypothetical protein MLD38_008374 [Melastoma candidum]
MAADLSRLHSSPPFCPFPVDCPLLPSPGLTSSDALTSSDEDHHCLAHLTCQMANHMLLEQSHVVRHKPPSLPAAAIACRDMPRWADLFTDSPQSSLWPSSGSSYCGKKASVPAYKSPPPEGYPIWDARPAYEPGTVENPDKIAPGLRWNQTLPSDNAKWTKEEKPSDIRPERAPKQGDSGKRKPRAKNNQWKTRKGECYVGLSLQHQQRKEAVSPGDDLKTRSVGGGSTGTGVFLPKTGGKMGKTEQGRKQPRGGGGGGCSTVLIPARVAQALLIHFSKMGHHPQPQPSPVLDGVPDSSGGGGWDQQKSQTRPLAEEPAIDYCNEMGLPQEWMY